MHDGEDMADLRGAGLSAELRWYVASCMDGGAHLGQVVAGSARVAPLCGRTPFRPLAALDSPTDSAQGCPGCVRRARLAQTSYRALSR